jgi:hypothetical protein
MPHARVNMVQFGSLYLHIYLHTLITQTGKEASYTKLQTIRNKLLIAILEVVYEFDQTVRYQLN